MWLYRPILSSATNQQNNALHHEYEGKWLIQPYCHNRGGLDDIQIFLQR